MPEDEAKFVLQIDVSVSTFGNAYSQGNLRFNESVSVMDSDFGTVAKVFEALHKVVQAAKEGNVSKIYVGN